MTLHVVRAPASEGAPRDTVLVCARATPEIGGLATTLETVVTDDMICAGWSGTTSERTGIRIDRSRAAFDLDPELREGFTGFSHRALRPLFHGFRNRIEYRDGDWQAYDRANSCYARYALELANLGAAIWIHDFELLLVAQALRRLGHRGPIGHFLHVPFPSAELFATLPWKTALLEGMLACDVLAFQTRQSADHFFDAARTLRGATFGGHDVVRYRGHETRVIVAPNTVDVAAFAAGTGDVAELAGVREQLASRRVLLGVDRLDYAKGIPERLAAYERLLERYPQWRRKVVLLQVCLTQHEIPDHNELRHRVESLVGRINGRFGEADWVPVCYLARSYSRAAIAELYRLADVAVVTPLRDGMNLVAKEFVAAQDLARPGVLVLSKFAGAAEQLISALLTNPFHCEGLAADLDCALQMPLEERRHRMHSLRRVLDETGTPASWASGLLDQLRSVRRNRSTT